MVAPPQKWWVQKASSRMIGSGTPRSISRMDRIFTTPGFDNRRAAIQTVRTS
jgi:hypothetical protein